MDRPGLFRGTIGGMIPKVLIVDDSMSARYFIKNCLTERDVDIREAKDGQEAIDVFPEYKPDIVFLDITMPVMNGFEALPRLKELGPDVPIVVLTADVQTKTVERIMSLGAFLFLKKPPRKPMILEALDKGLEVKTG
jgi:two-component system, chemotaxis family, chemotaxis protein CheY